MKRKLLAALLSMSLIGGLLAGCGSSDTAVTDSSPSTETGSEEVTLTFAIWSDEENYIRKVVDQYNADLFDQAGIPYPEQLTWEEYGDLAVELQKKLNVYGGYWVPWIFQFASVQSGKYVDNSDTSGLRYSLELLNRFYNVDQSHMSYADITATSADYIAEFENGKCAMLPNGEWCVNMFLEDEAFDFLSYLCGAEGSEVYSSCGMIHAYASDNSREAYIETTGRDSVSVFFDAEKIQEAPNTDSYNEILNAFNEHAQLYLLGETDIDTCISNFTAQRDSILAEYK